MVEPNLESKFVRRRRELGLTQKDIHEATGISIRSISKWEQGTTTPKLTPDRFSVLCKLLDCSIHELAGYFEELKPKT